MCNIHARGNNNRIVIDNRNILRFNAVIIVSQFFDVSNSQSSRAQCKGNFIQ